MLTGPPALTRSGDLSSLHHSRGNLSGSVLAEAAPPAGRLPALVIRLSCGRSPERMRCPTEPGTAVQRTRRQLGRRADPARQGVRRRHQPRFRARAPPVARARRPTAGPRAEDVRRWPLRWRAWTVRRSEPAVPRVRSPHADSAKPPSMTWLNGGVAAALGLPSANSGESPWDRFTGPVPGAPARGHEPGMTVVWSGPRSADCPRTVTQLSCRRVGSCGAGSAGATD